jgi:hypothetical protein
MNKYYRDLGYEHGTGDEHFLNSGLSEQTS